MTPEGKELLIYPKFVEDGDGNPAIYGAYESHRESPAGTRTYASAGAPGVGHVIHEITRVDDDGVWGLLVEDTMWVPGIEYYR